MEKSKVGIPSCSILTTGGTIDKIYSDKSSEFSVGDSETASLLNRINVYSWAWDVKAVLQKDSSDMTDEDRECLFQAIISDNSEHILITHGTDTICATARYLYQKLNRRKKKVVLTGSFVPSRFKHSDAEFNVGFALGILKSMEKYGVRITMNGESFDAQRAYKNHNLQIFTKY